MFEKHKIQRKLMKCEETRLSKSGALELSKKRKNKLRCFKFLCKTPCSGWSSKEPEKKKTRGRGWVPRLTWPSAMENLSGVPKRKTIKFTVF